MKQISAGQIASALVAACAEFKVDPASVFEKGLMHARASRQLAGASLKAVTGIPARTLAPMLCLSGPELSPSLLSKAGITTDMMLTVVEALGGPGLAADLSQSEAPAEASAAATAAVREDLPSVAVVADPPEKGGRKPRAAKPDPKPVAPEPPATKPVTAARRGGKGWRGPRAAKPVARLVAAPKVTRLKPVSADIARWSGWFVAADWDVEEVADLFNVHPDGLADALEFGVAA